MNAAYGAESKACQVCTEPIAMPGRGDFPAHSPIWYRAPVAQLDRAPDYESGGRRFESFRARQRNQQLSEHPKRQIFPKNRIGKAMGRSSFPLEKGPP